MDLILLPYIVITRYLNFENKMENKVLECPLFKVNGCVFFHVFAIALSINFLMPHTMHQYASSSFRITLRKCI